MHISWMDVLAYVRELQHTMERVVILGDGSLLKPENFQFHVTPKQKKEEEIVLNCIR